MPRPRGLIALHTADYVASMMTFTLAITGNGADGARPILEGHSLGQSVRDHVTV